jgi:hypothetical protein
MHGVLRSIGMRPASKESRTSSVRLGDVDRMRGKELVDDAGDARRDRSQRRRRRRRRRAGLTPDQRRPATGRRSAHEEGPSEPDASVKRGFARRVVCVPPTHTRRGPAPRVGAHTDPSSRPKRRSRIRPRLTCPPSWCSARVRDWRVRRRRRRHLERMPIDVASRSWRRSQSRCLLRRQMRVRICVQALLHYLLLASARCNVDMADLRDPSARGNWLQFVCPDF